MIRLPYRLRSHKGFSAIEAVVAVILFSWVAILISQMLLKTVRLATGAQMSSKATTLATMVFQQYSSYAILNFNSMPQYTNVTPTTFFSQSNLGFDAMTITSNVVYGTNLSSCTVNLTISWGNHSSNYSQGYFENISASGQNNTVLQAFVKIPCAAGTDVYSTINNCVGVPGAAVSVTSSLLPQPVMAVTNSQGGVALSGMVAGDTVTVQISAPAFSSFTIPDTDTTNYHQLYYALDSSGTYVTSISSFVVIGGTVPAVFTNFSQGATIFGFLGDTSTVCSNPGPASLISSNWPTSSCVAPQNNMAVELSNAVIASSAGLVTCAYTTCNNMTTTNNGNDGYFYFSNVIPMNFSLWAYGQLGNPAASTGPLQSPTDFGYTNEIPYTYSAGGPPSSAWVLNYSSGPYEFNVNNYFTNPTFAVDRMGWFQVKVATGSLGPVANAPIQLNSRTGGVYPKTSESAFTSSSGFAYFFNIIQMVPTTIEASATNPSGSLYAASSWTAVNMDAQANVTIRLTSEYTFVSTNVVDDSDDGTHSRMTGVIASVGTGNNGVFAQGTINGPPTLPSNPSTWLSISMFYPSYFQPGNPYQPFLTNNPSYSQGFILSKSTATLTIAANITGTVTEANTANWAQGVFMQMTTTAGVTIATTTSLGAFTLTGPIGWTQNRFPWVDCSSTTFQCWTCNGTTSNQIGFEINTSSTTAVVSSSPGPQGWLVRNTAVSVIDNNVMTVQLSATLVNYQVHGTITDTNSGLPLAGVIVNDPSANGAQTQTDSTGSYYIWANVQGRDMTQGNAGYVVVAVSANQTIGSVVYQGMTSPTLTIPTPATPQNVYSPSGANFSLSPTSGSHL